MKKSLALILVSALSLSLFFTTPIKTYALDNTAQQIAYLVFNADDTYSAYSATGDVIYSSLSNSTLPQSTISKIGNEIETNITKFPVSDLMDDVKAEPTINLQFSKVLGSLIITYNVAQGAKFTSYQSNGNIASDLGNHFLTSNSISLESKESLGSAFINVVQNANYFQSHGFDMISALWNDFYYSMGTFMGSSVQIDPTYNTQKQIPISVLALMPTEIDALLGNANFFEASSSRYQIIPMYSKNASTGEITNYDTVVINPDNYSLTFYNYDMTKVSPFTTPLITYMSRYDATPRWSMGAGYNINSNTFQRQNTLQNAIRFILDYFTGMRIFVGDEPLPNIDVDTGLQTDSEQEFQRLINPIINLSVFLDDSLFNLNQPVTMPVLVQYGVVQGTESSEPPQPDDGDDDNFPPVNKWFPIDPLSSIWHYVIELVNVGNDFIVALGQIVNSLPTEIWYPFLGGFVLCLLGAVIHKLLG